MSDNARSSPARVLATLGWITIVIAGMRAADTILVPMLLAIFLAFTCAPLVLWLEQKRMPAMLAVVIVVLLVILVGLGIGTVAGTSVRQFTLEMPKYQQQLRDEMTALLAWLQDVGVKVSSEDLLKYIDPGAAMRLGASMVSGLGEILTNSFLILLTVMFILFEASTFRRKVLAIWGDRQQSMESFSKFADDVYHYLAIKTAVSLGTGVLVAVWVALLGVDFPLLWGLLAFLLNYVPNLGSIIAAAPAVLLAMLQFGPGRALILALGYVVVNVVAGNILEPRLLGKRLGLSTLTVFLSLVFWGWVLGPIGMILSIPLTMVLKIALERNEDTRWIAVLLGSGSELRTRPAEAPASEKSEQVAASTSG